MIIWLFIKSLTSMYIYTKEKYTVIHLFIYRCLCTYVCTYYIHMLVYNYIQMHAYTMNKRIQMHINMPIYCNTIYTIQLITDIDMYTANSNVLWHAEWDFYQVERLYENKYKMFIICQWFYYYAPTQTKVLWQIVYSAFAIICMRLIWRHLYLLPLVLLYVFLLIYTHTYVHM